MTTAAEALDQLEARAVNAIKALGERTSGLSTKQVEIVERLWQKHFA